LPWTGERYVTSVRGEIEFEHTHRYLFAMPFAKGVTVLDIASGEGYGTHLLGSVARHVIGIDIDEASVAHARSKYADENLSFLRADCTAIPLSSDSVDLVVSFETLEHIRDHIRFLKEISRVLKADGILVISTPDRVPYNEMNGCSNPYHLKELDGAEFKLLLKRHFESVQLLGQCYLEGSLINSLKGGSCGVPTMKSDKKWVRYIEEPTRVRNRPARPIYLISIASNGPLPRRTPNLLTTSPARQPRLHAIRQAEHNEQALAREIDRLRAASAAAEEQGRSLKEAISDHDKAVAALKAEVIERATAEAALRAEVWDLRKALDESAGEKASAQNTLDEGKAAAQATEARAIAGDKRLAASLAELAAVRAAAADAQRESGRAIAALKAELEILRRHLADAERGLVETEAASTAWQAEADSLRRELTIAREVGRAALGSISAEPGIFTAPPRTKRFDLARQVIWW
jgi:hypothetical protein